MNYFLDGVKRYVDFSGRARRKEFWMYFLFYTIFYFVAAIIEELTGNPFITVIYALVLLLPTLSIGARRLHDIGRTGWWQLLNIIPLVGFIVLIVFFVQDSKPDNKYGANPKAA
tara:strand:+ start:8067 stop:8408 length:342 start_codon:yes stop_codon:yes gene_type:complete